MNDPMFKSTPSEVYGKEYGGSWKRLFCGHVWKHLFEFEKAFDSPIGEGVLGHRKIEVNKCIHCQKEEVLVLGWFEIVEKDN